MLNTGRVHITRRATTSGLLAALAAGAVLTAAADGAVRNVASPMPLGAPAPEEVGESLLHCRLDMPVRLGGVRFETARSGATVSCAGHLLGRPITGGVFPRATGLARFGHWTGDTLPAEFRKTEVRLNAVEPALPLQPPEHTAVNLRLSPGSFTTTGAGHYTGAARVRGRDHQAVAAITFQPLEDRHGSGRCCRSGRLVVDFSLSDADTPLR